MRYVYMMIYVSSLSRSVMFRYLELNGVGEREEGFWGSAECQPDHSHGGEMEARRRGICSKRERSSWVER